MILFCSEFQTTMSPFVYKIVARTPCLVSTIVERYMLEDNMKNTYIFPLFCRWKWVIRPLKLSLINKNYPDKSINLTFSIF